MQDYIVTSRDGSKHVRHRNVMPWHVNQVRNEYGMLQVFFGGPGTSARRETDMAFCSHFFFWLCHIYCSSMVARQTSSMASFSHLRHR